MRKAGDIAQEDDAHYKGALLQELRWIRQLLDTQHVFESEAEWQRRMVVEQAQPPPAPAKREVAKSTPDASPTEILQFDPEQLEWEEVKPRSGKAPYERYPPFDAKPEATVHYKGLRAACLSVVEHGRRFFNMEPHYYWLGRDNAVIYRRKQQR